MVRLATGRLCILITTLLLQPFHTNASDSLNCDGTQKCGLSAGGAIKKLLISSAILDSSSSYNPGARIACAGIFCTFTQNTKTVLSGDRVPHFFGQLVNGGCGSCGSVALQDGGSTRNDEFTVNEVQAFFGGTCDGLCKDSNGRMPQMRTAYGTPTTIRNPCVDPLSPLYPQRNIAFCDKPAGWPQKTRILNFANAEGRRMLDSYSAVNSAPSNTTRVKRDAVDQTIRSTGARRQARSMDFRPIHTRGIPANPASQNTQINIAKATLVSGDSILGLLAQMQVVASIRMQLNPSESMPKDFFFPSDDGKLGVRFALDITDQTILWQDLADQIQNIAYYVTSTKGSNNKMASVYGSVYGILRNAKNIDQSVSSTALGVFRIGPA